MSVGLLFAMTLPGLVVILLALAAVEYVRSRLGRASLVTGRPRPALSAAGMDVFASALMPGKADELEQRRVEVHLRDEADEGDPPFSPETR